MDKKEFIPIGPFRGWVLQNFPFIEADFDAITNYQLWCKVVEYINKIAYNEELLEDSNDELIDAFNNLKTYVETYLENLDVQGYVDNKLDEMAEDGTLEEIMESYVQVKGILAYNTLSDLKGADNLVDGSYTKIYGKLTYNDGLGAFYKIRLKTTEDVIDEDNIISLTNYPDLVGEKMSDKNITDIKADIGALNELNTSDKTSLVGATNETFNLAFSNYDHIGALNSLDTLYKKDLVGAINEVNGKIVVPVISNNYPDAVSVANNTVINVSSLDVSAGTYIVVGFGSFADNSTGYRQLGLGTSETGGNYDRSTGVTCPACSGTGTVLQVVGLFTFNTTVTLYLKAKQTSGSALSFSYGGIRAIKIK